MTCDCWRIEKPTMKQCFLRLLHFFIAYCLFTLACFVIYYFTESIYLWLSEKYCTYVLGLDDCPGGIDLLSCIKNDPITVSLSSKSEEQFHFCMGFAAIPDATSWLFFGYFLLYVICYFLCGINYKLFEWLNRPVHWSVSHDSIWLTKYHLYCGCWNSACYDPEHEENNVLLVANFNNTKMIALLLNHYRSTPDNMWLYSNIVLDRALKSGNYKTMDLLIEGNIRPFGFEYITIILAIEADMVDMVEYLLRKRGEEYFRRRNLFPLDTALRMNNVVIIKMLLAAGAQMNRRNSYGETSLQYMSEVEDRELLQDLIQRVDDINEVDTEGHSALYKATCKGNAVQVELLLAHGANADHIRDINQMTLLHIACKIPSDKGATIVKLLLEKGLSCNAKDTKGYTPFHRALEFGNIDAIKSLLKHGADMTIQIPQSFTHLHLAAANPHEGVLELILDMGYTDINAQNERCGIPLMFAAKSCSGRNFVILLRRHCCGKDFNSEKNRKFLTRLLMSVCMRYINVDPTDEVNGIFWDEFTAFRIDPPDDCMAEVFQGVIKFMAVMDFLNADASRTFETELLNPTLISYYKSCKFELRKMQNCRLIGTVSTVLTAEDKKLKQLMRYDDFVTPLKHLRNRFPIYDELMEMLFLREARVIARRRNANILLHQVLGPRVANYLVVKHILQYLEPDQMSLFDEPIYNVVDYYPRCTGTCT